MLQSFQRFLKEYSMNRIAACLLDWYDRCARDLPWRGFHDAYRTWVSETMLQQTRVDTVISYYHRFLKHFPDLPSLADASEADVLKLWEGLGYYSRARNLLRGARQVMLEYNGTLPRDPAQLRKIHGIGPYSAGAIASIAYDVAVPAVDGNVIRVLSRLYGIRTDVTEPDTLRHIEETAASLVPESRPGDYNQAVMDLGATVCVPGTPDCARCPLSGFCDAFRAGDAADLPLQPKAKPPRAIPYAVLMVFSGDSILMRRRTERMLQGLWCFPMFEGVFTVPELQGFAEKKLHLSLSSLQEAGEARHVFTHQVWQMKIYKTGTEANASAPDGYEFISPERFRELPLPTAMSVPAGLLRL